MPLRWTKGKKLRILHWDLENRPLSYMGNDFTSAEITAIACGWADEKRVHSWILGIETSEEMIRGFLSFWHEAGIVSGHYIRKHDLPMLNGALLEHGMPTLRAKLTSDTHGDLVRKKDLSASQESLAAMYELPEPKHSMNQSQWRAANRLTPEGLDETRRRVVRDVQQHRALRAKLLEMGALKGPKLWHG